MNSPETPGSVARSLVQPIGWVASSFVVFVLLFLDPLDLHPLDGWLRARLGVPVAAPEEAKGGDAPLYYRNPMDPTITSPVPKKDEMGMDYVPVYRDESDAPSGERRILFYRNPMDPTVTSPVPKQDSMGMDYVPVYDDGPGTSAQGGVTVEIDPAVVQNMNVQTAEVMRRDLEHELRTVGYFEYDQERMVTVTTKYSGWVEKVYVNYVGEPVKKGDPLFEVYSPELVQTGQELLSARAYASRLEDAPEGARERARALHEAARTRLSYWDVSPEQIAEIERSGEVLRTLQVVAPASGLVMKRMPGLEGMAVKPGMEAYHIADLSSLWLSVEVFEDQVALVREGTPASITLPYFPGEEFRGRVRFVEPELSASTRTLSVKLEVPNRGGRLRAGMFATVRFTPVAARGAVTVPSHAVLRTGRRTVVVEALGNGRFAPREVTLGHESRGVVEVLEGLEEGQRVVTSAQFLLDSEASLQEAVQKMIAAASEAPQAAEPMQHGEETQEHEHGTPAEIREPQEHDAHEAGEHAHAP